MQLKVERHFSWRMLIVILLGIALSVFSFVSLTGEHGVKALQSKIEQVGELQEEIADLKQQVEEKRKRVNALVAGQDLDQELHKNGLTHPDEIEYRVDEPNIPDAADDPAGGN
jgi:cell division protein FtsB